MRYEGERLLPVVRPEGRDGEGEGEGAGLPDRGDVEARRKEAFPKERGVDAKPLHRAALHRREPESDESLQLVEGLAAEDHELHQVGGVGVLVEVDELGPDVAAGPLGEGRLGTDVEAREGVPRVERLLPGREDPQVVAPAPGHVLGVDDPALAREVPGVEPRGDEELGEPVESAFEVRGVDFEEIARVRERGPRVAEAPVLGDEPVVLTGVRILPGAEEEHVFEEVRESRARFRVVRAPHVDVERGRRLVRPGVGDHEGLESVFEGERAIVPRVGGASLDREPAPERRRGAREEQPDRRAGKQAARGRVSDPAQRGTPGKPREGPARGRESGGPGERPARPGVPSAPIPESPDGARRRPVRQPWTP